MKDDFVWWAADQDSKETLDSTKSECYHLDQMGSKVNVMKWDLDKLLLGEE